MVEASKRFFQEVFRDFSRDAMPVNGRSFGVCGDLLAILYLVTYLAGLVLGPKAASGQIESKLSGAMGAQRAGQIQTMVKKGRGLKMPSRPLDQPRIFAARANKLCPICILRSFGACRFKALTSGSRSEAWYNEY